MSLPLLECHLSQTFAVEKARKYVYVCTISTCILIYFRIYSYMLIIMSTDYYFLFHYKTIYRVHTASTHFQICTSLGGVGNMVNPLECSPSPSLPGHCTLVEQSLHQLKPVQLRMPASFEFAKWIFDNAGKEGKHESGRQKQESSTYILKKREGKRQRNRNRQYCFCENSL